jgi:hypothetical protein
MAVVGSLRDMVYFILGMVVGFNLGVCVLAVLVISKT